MLRRCSAIIIPFFLLDRGFVWTAAFFDIGNARSGFFFASKVMIISYFCLNLAFFGGRPHKFVTYDTFFSVNCN